jgi:DNA helicase II / ATP-dependent DNA helicase PcrA
MIDGHGRDKTPAPDALDPAQQAAATAAGSAQLVLAGPGSGKTTTLTGRFVHLVRQGVDRRRILALTFTKKAADEMKARITDALGLETAKDLTVATFHGFTFRHLRANPQAAGLPEDFQLWDAPQQRHVFHSRKMWWNEDTDILDIIGGAKERLLDAERFAAQIPADDEVLRGAVDFFRVYEKALRAAGAIDFADMVPLVVKAMDHHADYARAITGAFDHVLVDEYQDVNPGQVRLIDRFVNAGVKLWAVGDDDQTLYAFRAADVRFILDFPRRYRGATVHLLDRNYRSAARIIACAERLIAHNRARRAKSCRPVVSDVGELVIRSYRSPEIEARQVARGIAKLMKQGHPPREIAALYRVGSIGLALQPALKELAIPYEVRGAGDLWQGVAARLVVGSLHYLRDGQSIDAMSRMGSSRRAEIVRKELDQERSSARASFAAACQLVRKVVGTALPAKASDRDRAEWASVVDAVIALAASCQSLDELESKIGEQSAALRKAPENAVVLSTIHSAKGLEWDAVFMVGLEDGVLPHANNDDLEEERRVAYVGMTRARKLVALTSSAVRFGQPARPSRFLRELADEHCIWTSVRSDGSDDRLPLLSERERHRLAQGIPAQPPAEATAGAPARPPGKGRAKARAVKDRATADRNREIKNRIDGAPPRQGVAWGASEDDKLRSGFLAGQKIAALAGAHQRTPGAIRSRLVKLGLIEREEAS